MWNFKFTNLHIVQFRIPRVFTIIILGKKSSLYKNHLWWFIPSSITTISTTDVSLFTYEVCILRNINTMLRILKSSMMIRGNQEWQKYASMHHESSSSAYLPWPKTSTDNSTKMLLWKKNNNNKKNSLFHGRRTEIQNSKQYWTLFSNLEIIL